MPGLYKMISDWVPLPCRREGYVSRTLSARSGSTPSSYSKAERLVTCTALSSSPVRNSPAIFFPLHQLQQRAKAKEHPAVVCACMFLEASRLQFFGLIWVPFAWLCSFNLSRTESSWISRSALLDTRHGSNPGPMCSFSTPGTEASKSVAGKIRRSLWGHTHHCSDRRCLESDWQ